MQDKELYRQLLGLKEPWQVSEIKVDFEELKVDLLVSWPPERQAPCPEASRRAKFSIPIDLALISKRPVVSIINTVSLDGIHIDGIKTLITNPSG